MGARQRIQFHIARGIRSVGFWRAGLRSLSGLLCLGGRNARALQNYRAAGRRALGLWPGQRFWRQAWLRPSQYGKLFSPVPGRAAVSEKTERDALQRCLRQVTQFDREYPAEIDPLSTERAVRLQSAVIRQTFWRLFALRVSEEDGLVLGRYGSVAAAVKEFLEYSGAGLRVATPDLLGWHLPVFVVRARARHEAFSAWRTIRDGLEEMVRLVGGVRSLWVKGQQAAASLRWARQRAREATEHRRQLSKAHLDAENDALQRLEALEFPARAGMQQALGLGMYVTALSLAADIADELRNDAAGLMLDPGRFEGLHEKLFADCMHRLEENLNEFLEEK